MPSGSAHRRLGLAACLWAAGCAGAAPPLPPPGPEAISAVRASAMECEAVFGDIRRIDAQMRMANALIEAERPRNQAAAYFAGVLLFPPLLASTEANEAERAQVTGLYEERDVLLVRARVMGCSMR